jgi:hypothetical protein
MMWHDGLVISPELWGLLLTILIGEMAVVAITTFTCAVYLSEIRNGIAKAVHSPGGGTDSNSGR